MNTFFQPIRKFIRPIQTLFVEYCDNSNIHGVRYLTEKFLHWSERLWWIIALGASLGLCGFAALNIWIEWRANPVTFSYTEPSIPISEIPLPTITICPETKTDAGVFDLTAALKSVPNLNESERIVLNSMAHICPHLHDTIEFKDNFAHEKIYRIFLAIAPRTNNIIFKAKLHHYASIVRILTERGICFIYNALNSHDIYTDDMAPEMMIVNDNNRNASNWSLEKDIQKKSTAERYPIHEIRSLPVTAFLALLKTLDADLEYQCSGSNPGFNVMLSAPGDALKFSGNSYRASLEDIMRIAIKPTLTITSDGLRKYNPHQRQCFFDSEHRLRFFKIYSQSNCEAECLANFTQAQCGCVKFSQPRDRGTKVCGGARINCYKAAEEMLSNGDSNTKTFRDKCNCLPSCTSIEYEANIERRTVDMDYLKKKMLSSNPNIKFEPLQFTHLQILFGDEQVNVVKRIESYTFSDFLAFCGGLLGIFLGISALSIVEIIYYATLRLYFIIRPLEASNEVTWFHQMSSNIFERFRFIRGIRAFIVEFCDNSNIHGVVYFTRRGLHWIERLWWLISFGLSFWLCSTMILSVWEGWQENPVKMTFTHNERPISNVPFPTVTICPNIKYMRHKMDLNRFLSYPINYRNTIRSINRSLRNDKNHRSVLHVCSYMQEKTEKDQMLSFPPIADENIYNILLDIAPQLHNVMHKCIWQGEVVNCSKYMATILTEFGYCFAFNAINSREIYTNEMAPEMKIVKNNSNVTNWSMENGYGNGTKQNDYPLRVYDSGRGSALEISLDICENDFDFICSSIEQGFRVTLGAPWDGELKYFVNVFAVSLLKESVITVKPKLTTTSEGLRKYDPNHRKCFFESERKLRFYKTYTRNNCKVECLANFTKKECGCVQFSQPRDNNTPVCGVGKFLCENHAENRLRQHLAYDKEVERKYLETCNCLPSCTTIKYNAAIDSVQFNKSAIAVTAGQNANMSGIHRAKLVIYFEDPLIETEQREELYTITDLFSICGGLFGLFMGISVLSIVEILYFSSLRWFWILRRPTSETN